MALSIGIVGLPNVGKSTTFNALTKAQNAEAANYPFCTIEPNKAVVAVPDVRLDQLSDLVQPKQRIGATIEFFDIAGLVKGASQGEGLGNQFLGHIRSTAAIVHVVRCFDDDNVVHINAHPDPRGDIEVINTELALADLQQVERKAERLAKQAKGDKAAGRQLEVAQALIAHLSSGAPARTFSHDDTANVAELLAELGPITGKKTIYAANVDEEGLGADNDYVKQVHAVAAEEGAEVVKLCAKMEEEMAGLSDEERAEFLESMGAEESGLDQVIHKSYAALGLISYFTAGPKEVRAWTVRAGSSAPQAAGVIHTDFERGFIRAEVISFDDYIAQGGEAGAKSAGVMRVEGRDYIVQDGDVMHFRFNV